MRRLVLFGVGLTVATVMVIMCVNSCTVTSTVKKYVEQEEQRQAQREQRQASDWQEAVVYDMIYKYAVQDEHKTGVSDVTIKKEYAGEASKWTNANFPKEEISDSALKKVLFELTKSGAIRRVNDRYLPLK